MTTLLSFLGTGNYGSCIYVLPDGREAPEGTFFTEAGTRLYDGVDSIVVAATDEAWTRHGEALARSVPEAARLPIPSGQNPSELWEIFKLLEAQLRPLDDVIIDVTHGFRALPLFTMGVLGYLRATGWRAELRLVYGAYEARTPGEPPRAPVWDLSPLAELFEWSLGLQMLLQTGRAEPVAQTLDRLGRAANKRWAQGGREGPQPQLTQLAGAMRTFGADLETVRVAGLLGGLRSESDKTQPTSTERLRAVLASSREGITAQVPALERPLATLTEKLDALSGDPLDSLASEAGHRRLAALARWYLELGRYPETLIVVREGRVLAHAAPEAGMPGPRWDRDAYDAAAWTLSGDEHKTELTDLRNDVEHGGLRKKPLASKSILEACARVTDHFAQSERASAPTVSQPANAVIVNLSNHPQAEWPAEMTRDVRARLGADVRDLAFPTVPATALAATDLEPLVNATMALLPGETTHAIVMGEHVLSAMLVAALQRSGVACFAPATTRAAETLDDGRVARSFSYAGLREYPRL